MKTVTDTYGSRFKKRGLPNLLAHKFLTEYGYDHGPVIARAIVDDILATIEECWPERVPPRTVVWLAVRREWNGRRRGLKLGDLVPVQLCIATEEEVEILMVPELRKARQARRAFNRARFARWCSEAFEQGGVLTQFDLSVLSGLSERYVRDLLHEYEEETGKIVPTRGTVCSDPQKLDRYDSSSRICLEKGETGCQSDEHSHRSSRPGWCWKSFLE